MKCIWCNCRIEEGEEQYTSDDEGPFCEDCFDEAEAEASSLDFRRIA